MLKFRLFNIPVHIHPVFWIFFLFFTNLYQEQTIEQVILGGVLILSLLVHEYGHALTALYFGAMPTINLEAFGGNAQYNGKGISPKQHFLITLNGPLFESILIVLPYFLLESKIFINQYYYYIQYFLYVTMKLNIIWCLFNLIPLAPLDGSTLFRYLLEKKFGHRADKICLTIGLSCAFAAIPYLLLYGFYFFAIMLVILAVQNFKAFSNMQSSGKEENNFKEYLKANEAVNKKELDVAKNILKKLTKSKDTYIKNLAVEALAKVYVQENNHHKSYDLLLRADHQYLKEGKCLLCKLALDRQNYSLISQYSMEIYTIEPSFEIALLNSKAFACLDRPVLSGAWLETASQFGSHLIENIKEHLEKPVFDLVRNKDDFNRSLVKFLGE